jgi:hypothetical protein
MGISAYPGVIAHQEPSRYVVMPLHPHTCGATGQAPPPGVSGTQTPVAEQPPDSL